MRDAAALVELGDRAYTAREAEHGNTPAELYAYLWLIVEAHGLAPCRCHAGRWTL